MFHNFFQITLCLSKILDQTMGSPSCFYRLPNVTSSAKFIGDKASLKNETCVDCGTIQNVAGNLYQVGLVYVPQPASIT